MQVDINYIVSTLKTFCKLEILFISKVKQFYNYKINTIGYMFLNLLFSINKNDLASALSKKNRQIGQFETGSVEFKYAHNMSCIHIKLCTH